MEQAVTVMDTELLIDNGDIINMIYMENIRMTNEATTKNTHINIKGNTKPSRAHQSYKHLQNSQS